MQMLKIKEVLVQLFVTYSVGPSESHPANSRATPNGRLCMNHSHHEQHSCLHSAMPESIDICCENFAYHPVFLLVILTKRKRYVT